MLRVVRLVPKPVQPGCTAAGVCRSICVPGLGPLLERDLQGLIMAPFNAIEFRERLDQMELGF